jgi:hypothetical protein
MTLRLLLALLVSTLWASAQTTALGTKSADSSATSTTPKTTEEEEDVGVIITPFRSLTPPEAKTSRTFQLSKVNKLGFTETSKELQRLYSAFATQRIIDGSPSGSSKATGYLTTVNYVLIQDLGDNRFLAKAAWPAAGPNEILAAGTETMAVLLLDKPAQVGDAGNVTAMHVGTVALRFTANYAPLIGKRLTLRREAFVECTTLSDSPAELQKFVEAINAGAEMSATTNEQVTCKKCGGLGFTREAQKGQLLDKRVPCVECASSGKAIISVETKFVP